MVNFNQLIGGNINLRPLIDQDAQSLFLHARDEEIARFTPIPHPYKLSDAKQFISFTRDNFEKGKYELGIELKETSEIIGMISLYPRQSNYKAEVGYWLGKRYWGRGVAAEALNLILTFGFQELKLERIYARVHHPNIASVRLLEKLGFVYEGRLRKNTLQRGKWMDDLLYGILKDEFKAYQ